MWEEKCAPKNRVGRQSPPMHLMSLLKAKAYSWARMEPSLASSKRLDDPHMNANCQNAQWLWFSYPYFLKKKPHPSYLDKPFIPWQTLHTLTNLSYIDKPFIPWQTFNVLTNPSYLDKVYSLSLLVNHKFSAQSNKRNLVQDFRVIIHQK